MDQRIARGSKKGGKGYALTAEYAICASDLVPLFDEDVFEAEAEIDFKEEGQRGILSPTYKRAG
jgi:hypothetical protein